MNKQASLLSAILANNKVTQSMLVDGVHHDQVWTPDSAAQGYKSLLMLPASQSVPAHQPFFMSPNEAACISWHCYL